MDRNAVDLLSAHYLDAGASPALTIGACLLGLSTIFGVAVAGANGSGTQASMHHLTTPAVAHDRSSVRHAREIYRARQRMLAQR